MHKLVAERSPSAHRVPTLSFYCVILDEFDAEKLAHFRCQRNSHDSA
jgi:hypothetical protein